MPEAPFISIALQIYELRSNRTDFFEWLLVDVGIYWLARHKKCNLFLEWVIFVRSLNLMNYVWISKCNKFVGFPCIFLINYFGRIDSKQSYCSHYMWYELLIINKMCCVAFKCFGLATLSNHNVTSNAILFICFE